MSKLVKFLLCLIFLPFMLDIFTVCNSSCGKVIFSQVSLILSGGGLGACVAGSMCGRGGGGDEWQGDMHGMGCVWQGGMHGRGHVWWGHAWLGGMCGRRDGHCSGRYASYWNAFLWCHCLLRLISTLRNPSDLETKKCRSSLLSYQVEPLQSNKDNVEDIFPIYRSDTFI